jgi:hypothetical protein
MLKRDAFRLVILFLTAGALLETTAFAQLLGNDVKVAHVSGQVRWSKCAFTADGVLHIVFDEKISSNRRAVQYVSFDGTNFSAPLDLAGGNAAETERPAIAAGPKGMLVATWGDAEGEATYMRVFDPRTKSWLPVEAVQLEKGYSEPEAAVDQAGNIYVFFSDEFRGMVFTRCKIGGVWQPLRLMSEGYSKDGGIACGPDGTIWAVWRQKENGRYNSYWSKRTASTAWSTRQIITEENGSSSHPHIAVGPNNIAVAAWGDIDAVLENGTEMRVWRLGVDAHSELVVPFGMWHFPRIAIDKDNKIHMVYQIGGGDFGDGLRYTNNISGSWQPLQTIPAYMPKIQGISTEPTGNVAVCQSSWVDHGIGGSDIWVYSLRKIEPHIYYPPLNPSSTIILKSARRNREITYNLSWAANPQNSEAALEGYQIYVDEGSGVYSTLVKVAKTALTAAVKFTDLTKRRLFAVTAVGLGGIESDMVYFAVGR